VICLQNPQESASYRQAERVLVTPRSALTRPRRNREMADKPLCLIDGCDKPAKGRGWCAAHWWRWRNHGDPLGAAPKLTKPMECSVEGCGNAPTGKRGMCNAHYLRWYRHGDVHHKTRADDGEPDKWLRAHVEFDGDESQIRPFARGRDGRGRTASEIAPQAHRAMCILVHGEPPSPAHEAAHACGKGHEGCINPKHLRWATPSENSGDRWIHGTEIHGAQTWNAKLTAADVVEIRSLRGSLSQRELGERYGVDRETIGDAQRRVTWKHVP
jgi:hypothetical protein